MNKIELNELIEKYKDKPSDKVEYVIDGVKYNVTRYYCGNKDLNEVLYNLAFKQAYQDIQNMHQQNIYFGGSV